MHSRHLAGLLALALGFVPAAVQGARPEAGVPVRGQVFPADGGEVRGLLVSVRGLDSGEVHSAAIQADGRFELPPPPRDPVVELVVRAGDPAAADYHAVLAHLRRDQLAEEVRVVLVPRRWVIPAGTYAGTTVEISLQRAFTPPCSGCSSFYRQGGPDPAGGRAAHPESWPATAFPLRVAFDRVESRAPVTARDSLAFWRVADAMSRDYGQRLLRPARYHDAQPQEGRPGDVILVSIDPSIRGQGLGTFVSWRGDIVFGAVRVRAPALLAGASAQPLVTHELMHALGIGHTCAWRSVVAMANVCPARRASSLTAHDVAYTQLLARVREMQFALGGALGIDASRRGEGARE